MNFRKNRLKRDWQFYQYKILQIAVLIAVSAAVYLIYVVFDLERFDNKDEIINKPVDKEELRPQNILKRYIPEEKIKE